MDADSRDARVRRVFLELQDPEPRLVTWAELSAATGISADQCRRIIQAFDGREYLLAIDSSSGAQLATYADEADVLTAELDVRLRQMQALANTRRLA
jgi:hypothetical protein